MATHKDPHENEARQLRSLIKLTQTQFCEALALGNTGRVLELRAKLARLSWDLAGVQANRMEAHVSFWRNARVIYLCPSHELAANAAGCRQRGRH